MLVSIIIPAYKAEKYIAETIQSVLDQTYPNWELIIIDDGSPDNQKSIIEPFLKDPRIQYHFQENQGVSVARNHGISIAKGVYIAFLDADDIFIKDNLEIKIAELEKSKSDYVFSNMIMFDSITNQEIQAESGKGDNILQNLLEWNGEVIPGPCSNLIVSKEFLIKNKISFNKELSTFADQYFCVQIARFGHGVFIEKVLWKYRLISDSMSRNISVMEKDCLKAYYLFEEEDLFHNKGFKSKCFSNMYLILAGSWWVNGQNKLRGFYFMVRSFIVQPFYFTNKMLKKLI